MLLLIQTRCSLNKEHITIIDPHGNEVMEYGVDELSKILGEHFNVTTSDKPNPAEWNIVLKTDSTMVPFSFSVEQSKENKYKSISLSGHDETCVLHAVYTMLERMGYTFDLTGIRKPDNPSIQKLSGYSKIIKPVVKRRGIRQHINFVMDISSYPLDEAKEYIRNLARLRMNYITFHSYPGQWFSYKYKGTEHLAGNFFYGEQDVVPKDTTLKKLIRNDSIYCIPAIEPYWNDLQKRSQMAIQWLNAVMAEAKRVGLTVNFSYELRVPGIDYAKTTCDAILKEYPLIDGIEFITEEDARNYLDQIKNDVNCVKELKGYLRERNIQISTGVYITSAKELKEGFDYLRSIAPPDLHLTVLPAHGARMVAKNLKGIPFTSDDINRTMIYSWIQFDGLMYLQQNPVVGIRSLIADNLKINHNKPLYGICWNHWQNYENRTAARYASEAMIEGPIPVRTFYESQAKRLEIANSLKYASAMSKLDETDNFCRDSLFNIGFCPNNYWLKKPGLSLYGRYPKENLLSAIKRYIDAKNDLEICIADTKSTLSKRDLQFLVNRINCSILHLKAFVAMTYLQPLFKGNPNPVLSRQDRTLVVRNCSEALSLENDYLEMFSKFILDRGCEGILISYFHGPVQTLKNIMAEYGYVKDSIPVP